MAWQLAIQICDEELSRRAKTKQLDLVLEPAPEPAADADTDVAETEPEPVRHEPRIEPTATPSGRLRWTRETIVEALASWLLARSPTEAAFVARHGPRGLVAAACCVVCPFTLLKMWKVPA